MSDGWLQSHKRAACGEGWRDGVAINWSAMKEQPWKPNSRGSSELRRIK